MDVRLNAPHTEFAQTLYSALGAFVDREGTLARHNDSSAFAASLVADLSLLDLFIAYSDLVDYAAGAGDLNADLFERASYVAACGLHARDDDYGVVEALATFSESHAASANAVASEIFELSGYGFTVAGVTKIVTTDLLGRLTKQLHETVVGSTLKRADYLRHRIIYGSGNLDAAARKMAITMASEWDGTLDSLLETATTLSKSAA
jgi:hypothetical protein